MPATKEEVSYQLVTSPLVPLLSVLSLLFFHCQVSDSGLFGTRKCSVSEISPLFFNLFFPKLTNLVIEALMLLATGSY